MRAMQTHKSSSKTVQETEPLQPIQGHRGQQAQSRSCVEALLARSLLDVRLDELDPVSDALP